MNRSTLLAVLLAVSTQQVFAAPVTAPVLDFNQAQGGTGLNRDQSVGWSFDVLQPITVTHLAWFDQNQDGLSTSHRVGLWGPDGLLETQALIPAGVEASLDGIWRVVDVSDFVLQPGEGYVIGGTNSTQSTDRLAAGRFPIQLDPRIEHMGSRFSDFTTQLVLPALSNPATSVVGFYGPSFNAIAVPEPDTVWLLLSFTLICAWRRA